MVDWIGDSFSPPLHHQNPVLHRRMNTEEGPPGSRDTDPYYPNVRSQDGLITMTR